MYLNLQNVGSKIYDFYSAGEEGGAVNLLCLRAWN